MEDQLKNHKVIIDIVFNNGHDNRSVWYNINAGLSAYASYTHLDNIQDIDFQVVPMEQWEIEQYGEED